MSFFKKFTPVGSTPIVTQKPVVRTASDGATPTSRRSGTSNGLSKPLSGTPQPRRSASSTVLVSNRSRTSTTATTPEAISPRKRKLDSAKSTPNLKRSSPSSSTSGTSELRHLKLPSPTGNARHLANGSNGCSRGVRGSSVASSSHRSPRPQRLESSDDESDDDRSSKRSKHGSTPPRAPSAAEKGNGRKMVHPISFHKRDPKTGEPVPECKFIHADEIASVNLKGWSRRPGEISPPKLSHQLPPKVKH